jgi:putative MATE family efflux protein
MIYSLAVTIAGVLFTEALLRLIGISDALVAQATAYMRWQFVAGAINGIRVMTGSSLQASGDTITPMKATMTARVIDLVLSPLLMFGWLGFPEVGLAGPAVSNACSQTVSSAMNIRVLMLGTSRLQLRLSDYRFDFPLIKRLVRLAVPASISSVERSVSQMLLVVLIAPFGDIALASYALTQRMQNLVNFGTQGVGNASGVIAGQNLGAGNVSRARATVLWALGYVVVIKLVIVGILFTWPTLFLGIFSSDPELLEVGSKFLRILLIGYFSMGIVQVLTQSFQISGDTFMPMVVTLTGMWLVSLPLAMALSGAANLIHPLGLDLPVPTIGHLGQYGVAWAITIDSFFRLCVYLPYFAWGPWWKKRVLDGVARVPNATH